MFIWLIVPCGHASKVTVGAINLFVLTVRSWPRDGVLEMQRMRGPSSARGFFIIPLQVTLEGSLGYLTKSRGPQELTGRRLYNAKTHLSF